MDRTTLPPDIVSFFPDEESTDTQTVQIDPRLIEVFSKRIQKMQALEEPRPGPVKRFFSSGSGQIVTALAVIGVGYGIFQLIRRR